MDLLLLFKHCPYCDYLFTNIKSVLSLYPVFPKLADKDYLAIVNMIVIFASFNFMFKCPNVAAMPGHCVLLLFFLSPGHFV